MPGHGLNAHIITLHAGCKTSSLSRCSTRGVTLRFLRCIDDVYNAFTQRQLYAYFLLMRMPVLRPSIPFLVKSYSPYFTSFSLYFCRKRFIAFAHFRFGRFWPAANMHIFSISDADAQMRPYIAFAAPRMGAATSRRVSSQQGHAAGIIYSVFDARFPLAITSHMPNAMPSRRLSCFDDFRRHDVGQNAGRRRHYYDASRPRQGDTTSTPACDAGLSFHFGLAGRCVTRQ